MYEGDGAEEEVREEDPVHDGRPHDGQDGEDGGRVLCPGSQEKSTQVIELWYPVGLAVDVVDLEDPVGGVETEWGHHRHHEQPHHQPSLLQGPGHGEEGGPHHGVPDGETKHWIVKRKILRIISLHGDNTALLASRRGDSQEMDLIEIHR